MPQTVRTENDIREVSGLAPLGVNGLPENLYRGGESMEARAGIDVKVDPETGLIKPGRGISLRDDPMGLERFGGARQIDQSTIPSELEIKQVGRPGHYEITPREPMTIQRYNELLGQIKLK